MKIQIIVLCALVFSAVSYTEENGVLILTDDDFPTITEEFPFLMIEFYAPWYLLFDAGVDTAKNWPPSTMKSPLN